MEYQQFKDIIKDAKPVVLDEQQTKVIAAWNMMRGEIVWDSLDFISEYLSVKDIELFFDGLLVLQEHARLNR